MKLRTILFLAATAALTSGCSCICKKSTPTATFEERFNEADANKDGKVSRKEFGGLMIEKAFALYDNNKDGYITLKEFVAGGGSPEAFAQIDRDGNGRITLEEAKSSKVAMDAMTIGFYAADADKDGYVTLGEALAYREKARAYTR